MPDNHGMTTTTTTSTENRWNKGNVYDRAARRANLLRWWGDGTTAPCVWCMRPLFDRGDAASGAGLPDHVTADHILCHSEGGRYVMRNLVPACDYCNKSRGAATFNDYAAARGVDAEALQAHADNYRPRARGR